MSDLISRQAAIEETWKEPSYTDPLNVLAELRDRIKDLPSAQPEPQWIPRSERLPEEKKDVLIAFKHNMAVGFWEDILDNGEHVWYANSGDGWMTDTANVDSDGIPIAWMPLPEPYKGVT